MSAFFELLPPDLALEQLLSLVSAPSASETIPTGLAFGRVTTAPVYAPCSLPPFARSTVDGFAVRIADTYGACVSLPVYVRVIGEVPMGEVADLSLDIGQVALIHTGGMLPANADAVAMVEKIPLADSTR